jgi:enamine deaminase RidA (YjgF/YER057c/UK114 family)
MAHEYLKPAGLFDSQKFGFTQVVTSPPGKLVFVSGQTAWTETLEIAGGDDLQAQTAQALENLQQALAAAGARPADVTHLRLFIVDYSGQRGYTPGYYAAFFADPDGLKLEVAHIP